MSSDGSDDGDLARPLARVGQVVEAEVPWSKHRVKAALFGEPVVPPTVGQYEIRGTLGRGGMGVVLDAYDASLGRRVALKLLSPRLSHDEAATARLLREAQALARLSHPNVVHVYETGTTDDGQVYLAMERVEGQTLLSWQRAASRGWRECLEMYLQAGEGLAAAHAGGLVHRDFKPSNCMVDDKGRVRVLDFGLALALDEGTEDPGGASGPSNDTGPMLARLTRRGTVVGTVAYMAPEQLAGLPTDLRSDQFSFCVALYEALCGRMPFAGDSISERHEAIRVGRPQPAALRVPRALLHVLRRGLAFEPEQRHSDLPSLLKALRRIPEARRRGQVGGVLAVAVVGLGAWQLSVESPSPCEVVREQAPRGWDEARRNAVLAASSRGGAGDHRAGQVVSEQLDAYAAAWQQERFETCVQQAESPELASRRRACLDRLDGKLSALTEALGRAEGAAIGQAVVAVQELTPAATCGLVDGRGYGTPPTAEQEAAVAQVREQIDAADTYLAAEQAGLAREASEQLVSRARATGHAATLIEALLVEGKRASRGGEQSGAWEALLEALSIAEREGADLLAMEALVELVFTSVERSQVRMAEGWLHLLDGKVGRVGEPDSLRAKLLTSRGQVAQAAERHADAVRHFGEAVEHWRRKYGDGDLRVARARDNLATALAQGGRLDEARAVRVEMLARLDARFAAHPARADFLYGIASLDFQRGKPAAAIDGFERSLEILRSGGAEHGVQIARAELGLSRALADSGHVDMAASHADVAAKAVASFGGGKEVALREAIASQQAALCYMRRDFRGALDAYRRVAEILASSGEFDPIASAMLDSNAGEAALGLGALELADARFTNALAVLETRLPADDERLAYPLRGRGEVLVLRGDPAAARPLLERALGIHEAHAFDPVNLAEIRWALARALIEGSAEAEQGLVRERAVALARDARDELSRYEQGTGRLRQLEEFLQ